MDEDKGPCGQLKKKNPHARHLQRCASLCRQIVCLHTKPWRPARGSCSSSCFIACCRACVCVCVRVCMCTRARGELRAPAVLAAAMCNDPMLGVRAEHCEGATTAKKAKGRFQKPICPSLPGVRLVSPARGRHMRRLGRMLPRAGTRKLSPASAEGLRRETGVLAQLAQLNLCENRSPR
jgi:hypothetical protein